MDSRRYAGSVLINDLGVGMTAIVFAAFRSRDDFEKYNTHRNARKASTRVRYWIVLFALLSPVSGFARDFSNGKWIDLTHPFNERSVYWPTASEFKKTTVFDGQTEGGWHYSAFDFSAAEHGGTHIDAPIHFAEGKQSTEQIPIEHLVGPGFVINLRDKTSADRDYQVTVDDIQSWEKQHGAIPPGAIVLFDLGFSKYYPDRIRYLGTDERGKQAVAKLHFPGIGSAAARFLAIERAIHALGLDTASLDSGQSSDFMSHRILLEKNIPGFENLTNLDQLPATGSFVIALPMKIEGGSGGPLRIVAFIPERSGD